ncbi:MAG: hypothetical protein J6A82_02490 [Coprococcus sp.]|nr:hypothetical protein [Coprococcus sp.]
MNLKTDPRLNNMHPLKREILFRLSHTSTNLSPEELLPQVMKINQELHKRNLSFTKEESDIVIDILTENMSPAEKQKINMIRSMI